MSNTYIFVYGSLKCGFQNNYYLKEAIYIDDALTCEKYAMYPARGGDFPFAIKSERINCIEGEVYRSNSAELLNNLDLLEGYPNLYVKEFINAKLSNGKIIEALIYFKNEDTNKNAIDKTNKSLTIWV